MKYLKHFKLITLLLGSLTLQSCQDTTDFFLLDQKVENNQLIAKSLSEYQGKWLLINFWAEWCAPCLKEIPEINQLYQQKSQLNLEVIGVSFDPLPNSEIQSIAHKWNMKYPIMATDPMPILPFALPDSLPGNYIINPKGELVATLKGEQTFKSLSKLLITLKKKSSQSE
jgi:thiol-disulfide isomerase/thioredoxin